MRLSRLRAQSDLVGRRVWLAWDFDFEPGETLAAVPRVRVRRKARDFQFPPPGSPDSFLVYDSDAFPTPGTVASELPPVDRTEAGRRKLTRITSLSRTTPDGDLEVARLTETTFWDLNGEVLRREVRFLDIGDSVDGLVPGTVYYYQMLSPGIPADADPADAQATAACGEAYALGRTLFNMLPAIHRRHDTVRRAPTPGAELVPEAATGSGQLRRFIDPFGAALDAMRSSAESLRGLYDLDSADHRVLPLLARMIGWDLSLDLPIPNRRHEIKYAPALYRLTGTVPSGHIWTQLASGWPTRVKEYTHNVFHASEPHDLNVWLAERDAAGAWTGPEEPLVVEGAFGGRPSMVRTPGDVVWLFYHAFRMNRWGIWATSRSGSGPWTSSAPLTEGRALDRHPAAAALPDGSLRLFWDSYDTITATWRVMTRERTAAGDWQDPQPFGAATEQRKHPATTVDGSGRIWLFWDELTPSGWRLRYARGDGTTWSPTADFPDVVIPQGAPSVVPHTLTGPNRRLWLFWEATEETSTPGHHRRVLVFRTKSNLGPGPGGWSPVQTISTLPPTFHDADPYAFVNADGDLELVWSSNRERGWSVWSRTFDPVANAWAGASRVTGSLYDERYPVAVVDGARTVLAYRSDRSPVFESAEPGGIRSVDFRYTGSTVPDTTNPLKQELRGSFDDFQTYTYDTGEGGRRSDRDRYAHDTVGLFLRPTTSDTAEVADRIGAIRQVVADYLPVTKRAVLVLEDGEHVEWVYEYERAGLSLPRLVGEGYRDVLNAVLVDEAFSEGIVFSDSLS